MYRVREIKRYKEKIYDEREKNNVKQTPYTTNIMDKHA